MAHERHFDSDLGPVVGSVAQNKKKTHPAELNGLGLADYRESVAWTRSWVHFPRLRNTQRKKERHAHWRAAYTFVEPNLGFGERRVTFEPYGSYNLTFVLRTKSEKDGHARLRAAYTLLEPNLRFGERRVIGWRQRNQIPVGSRTTVQRETLASLTSVFGMRTGVTLPL